MAKSTFSPKLNKNDQKLIKNVVKKVSKLMILNGKIEFFTKIHLIDTKITQKSLKIDQKLVLKIRSLFDYQKGG